MTSVIHDSHAWLDAVQEDIIEPERRIIDPHHHLWARPNGDDYLLEDLWADTDSGHRVEQTVFIECHASYRKDGPEYLRPVGETEFVAAIADASEHGGPDRARITGIVAHADLRLPLAQLNKVLAAHQIAGGDRFKGIRQSGAFAEDNQFLFIKPRQPAGLYADVDFRRGVALLGERGLTYDTWHYHYQNRDFLALVRAVPDTTIILDHFGTPLGVGSYAGQREAIFDQWQDDIAAIAECKNVYAKLGGLAMPDNGFGWNLRDTPPSSDEFVATQARYYEHTLACFGVERCLFESNFPVDKWSLSYHVVWNGFKKMVQHLSETEKHQLFYANAAKVYRL